MQIPRWMKILTDPRERLRRAIEQRRPLEHTGEGMVEAIHDGMRRD